MNKKTLLVVSIIALVGLALAAAVLRTPPVAMSPLKAPKLRACPTIPGARTAPVSCQTMASSSR